jgi:hypothetical protein
VESAAREEGSFYREEEGIHIRTDDGETRKMSKTETFEGGATREVDVEKLDYEGFLNPLVLERFAKYMHRHRHQADGELRESDNWQSGMPINRYMKSLMRHVMELWIWHRTGLVREKGERDPQDVEEILAAIYFNVGGIMWELLRRKLEAGEED